MFSRSKSKASGDGLRSRRGEGHREHGLHGTVMPRGQPQREDEGYHADARSTSIPAGPDRNMQQQDLDVAAEKERAMKEMEAKHKAELAKMQAEHEESMRKISEDTETELKQIEEESAQQLSVVEKQYEKEMTKQDLIKQKQSEEFEALKQRRKLATEEFKAKEKAQKEFLTQKRHEREEEDKKFQSELDEELEDQVVLNMIRYDEKKIQTYREIEENRKKADEDVKLYRKAAQEKAQEEVMKMKKEIQDAFYRR